MSHKEPENSQKEYEKSLHKWRNTAYILRLYVAGMTPKSVTAIGNIRRICEQNLKGRYELEVFDVYQQPDLAVKEQIIVAPTLIKRLPLPLRKLVGDMSNEEKVLVGLDLQRKT